VPLCGSEYAKSEAALVNLRKICDEHLSGSYKIKVINLLKDPQLARDDQATPTLVRKLPLPVRRIVSDLCRVDRVGSGA
jgi:circadian clock protein KaiB